MDLSPSSGGVRKSFGYLYRQEKSSSFDLWGFQSDRTTPVGSRDPAPFFFHICPWEVPHLVKCSDVLSRLYRPECRVCLTRPISTRSLWIIFSEHHLIRLLACDFTRSLWLVAWLTRKLGKDKEIFNAMEHMGTTQCFLHSYFVNKI